MAKNCTCKRPSHVPISKKSLRLINSIDIAVEFGLHEELVYLNHAAVAPWPRRTVEVIKHFAEENCALGAKNYNGWLGVETQLRVQLQQLINAPAATDIALLKNTSEGLSFIAHGLPWRAGDNVVISDQEFPSNRIVWESLARHGVEVRRAALSDDDPEKALLAEVDERTRLLAVSSVQYATGLRLNLEKLGEACRQHKVLFCVDAIQSLGALVFDVQHIQADFVVADAHKWMLGPEGIALFYCREELRQQLTLHEFGWHMVEDYSNYDRLDWTLANSARRFECGSPNMLGIFALHASLSLCAEVGISHIEQAVLNNTRYLMQAIKKQPKLTLVTPSDEGRFGGIVTFKWHDNTRSDALFEYLSANGIVCAMRGGGVRFSAHFYTSQKKLDQALDILSAFR